MDKRNMKVKMFDPPEGWKYGFPCQLPENYKNGDFCMVQWLREKGYPEHLMNLALSNSRYWEEEI